MEREFIFKDGFSEEWDVAIGMKVACMLGGRLE